MPPPTLRLLADDLTGALDSAARFVPLTGPVPVFWDAAGILPPTAARDAGTREQNEAVAEAAVQDLAPMLAGADIAFKKIDSLLRGHVAAELAACLPWFDHCVLAPAFPFQGRITRDGRQRVREGPLWRDTGPDLAAALAARDLDVAVRNAAIDADLDAIVATGRALSGRVLWCGTGGLAGALAGHRAVPRPVLPTPILALVGSDHGVSAAQLAAAGDCLHRLPSDGTPDLAPVHRALRTGAAAVCVTVPDGTARSEAAQRIGACFASLLAALPHPGTLVVAGGETLRRLCVAIGVTSLEVDGEIVPGVPASRMRGGAWDGQRLVSKSGAFGDAGFLARLLRPAQRTNWPPKGSTAVQRSY